MIKEKDKQKLQKYRKLKFSHDTHIALTIVINLFYNKLTNKMINIIIIFIGFL